VKDIVSPDFCWTAIIPLRQGSKGMPGKNINLFAGKPLYMHAVEQALSAGATKVILSTDIPEVLCGKYDSRVVPLVRPKSLCGDEVPMSPVLSHAIEYFELNSTVVLLQATSPLRKSENILDALKVWWGNRDLDLVISIAEFDSGILKCGTLSNGIFKPLSNPEFCFSNRQTLPKVYKPNGAIYVFNSASFLKNGNFNCGKIGVIEMSLESSVDIDSINDFAKCEEIFYKRMEIRL
jgi:CMP-N-acetylneuraminic acid synthetase